MPCRCFSDSLDKLDSHRAGSLCLPEAKPLGIETFSVAYDGSTGWKKIISRCFRLRETFEYPGFNQLNLSVCRHWGWHRLPVSGIPAAMCTPSWASCSPRSPRGRRARQTNACRYCKYPGRSLRFLQHAAADSRYASVMLSWVLNMRRLG